MRRLPLMIIVIVLAVVLMSLSRVTRSPHGDNFKISCDVCHSSDGWSLDKENYSFDHNTTNLPLVGTHKEVDCRSCHPTLVFSEAKTECIDCHTDMHNQTVGLDCGRCHTPKSWIVENTSQLHQRSRFPLLGAHATADCERCHPSASLLKFEPVAVDCFSCHRENYYSTAADPKVPNHVAGNYSTNCTECHLMTSFSWTGAGINHNFFPLTLGHSGVDCQQCHTVPGNYSNISKECFSCHESNYNAANNPVHKNNGFSTNCTQCHTTNPGWKPADFSIHDGYFPIYSGKHNGEWNSCADCHTNAGNYNSFSCIDCHEHSNQANVNEEHNGVGGYEYNSNACFQCHPQGNGEGGFDHNISGFPLTGAHTNAQCSGCHANGYSGTSTLCADCHLPSYNQSVNPNHSTLGLSTDCASCHTTEPDWKPATFAVHDTYYPLTGAHTSVSTDCATCHQGNYSSSPNTCVGCHQTNYNQTTNPNHATAQISTECGTCHTTAPGWKPATFATHSNYYPLIGEHATTDCAACHTTGYSNTINTCVGCHQTNYNQTTNPNHAMAQISTDCGSCHTPSPDWKPATFTIHNNYFPLTGAHTTTDCASCHISGYSNTPNTCVGCHQTNYNQTSNPNHASAGISTDCASCHTTNPNWTPATFTIHNTFYPLTGAHATTDCASCHNGVYSNTPNTCAACHISNYNQTTNPNHTAAGISTDCATCHTTNPDWKPATFAVHNNYYPLLGAHASLDCASCHNGVYTNTPNTCVGCHLPDYNQTNDPPHASAQFPTDCETCHTQTAWVPSTFNHDAQYFPIYSGKHKDEWNVCSDCHPNSGNYAVFTCTTSCHPQSSTNDDHNGVPGYVYESSACLNCHPDGSDSKSTNRFMIKQY